MIWYDYLPWVAKDKGIWFKDYVGFRQKWLQGHKWWNKKWPLCHYGNQLPCEKHTGQNQSAPNA